MNGDVGSPSDPIKLDAPSFSGSANNIYVQTGGSLELGDVLVGDTTQLHAGGSITQTPGSQLVADTLDIHAGGSIGPLDTNVDTITGSAGGDITIHNGSNLVVDGLSGNDITLVVDGTLGGGVISGTALSIDALGDVGTPDHPLIVSVSGKVTAGSHYGLVFIRNVYKAPIVVTFAFVLRIPFFTRSAGGEREVLYLYAIIGFDNGTLRLLGIVWNAGDNAAAAVALGKLLLASGVREVRHLFCDGLDGFADAFLPVFPHAAAAANLPLYLRNAGVSVDAADKERLYEDWSAVCNAATQAEAEQAAANFQNTWGERYASLAAYAGTLPSQQQTVQEAFTALRKAGCGDALLEAFMDDMLDAVASQKEHASAYDAALAAANGVYASVPVGLDAEMGS